MSRLRELSFARNIVLRLSGHVHAVRVLIASGLVAPERPDRTIRGLLQLRRWGASPAAGYAVYAQRTPDRPAVIDEIGTLTFAQIDARTNAIARGLRAAGVTEGSGVAILCRNHRGFVEATIACSKLGANVAYLNTSFAGPQITEVCKREGMTALIYDEEFTEVVAGAAESLVSFVAWHDGPTTSHLNLEQLATGNSSAAIDPPSTHGRLVILTSGTTGLPKGAPRTTPSSVAAFVPLFSKIPLRGRKNTVIAAPLFHTWGFGNWAFALSLGATVVLQRRFDPDATLAAVDRHDAHTLVVVPVMLQRMLELPKEAIERHDTSSLRVINASGSALPGELATTTMDAFGDVLYNLYGSTEVAWASIATPEDLRAAPGTAGRPPVGTTLRILDDQGKELPQGQTGRIFVGNELSFRGYTGGGDKERIDGLLSSGDVGFIDEAGRLFISGRDDEMIISGGENVFPREVEDLLHEHDAIEEVAILGVEDDKFGQRLRAFVVLRPGAKATEDELKDHVKDNLARFKVPREIVFLDTLPRNPTGKVLKRELQLLQV